MPIERAFAGFTRAPRRHTIRTRRAFTLLETGLATIIIGVGVLAIIEAQQAFLVKNAWSTNSATGTYLASEIREMARNFPRHDRFSGGIYFTNPNDASSFTGWGPETGETNPEDFDDLDDLDGAVFGDATNFPEGFTMRARFPGPINAFGEVISQTNWDGTVETIEVNGNTQPVSLRGYTQIVQVDKLNPADFSQVVPQNAQEGSGSNITRPVDQYPLRVRVTVLFQSEFDVDAVPLSQVTWVVSP